MSLRDFTGMMNARYHLALATSQWGRSHWPRPPPSCFSCSWPRSPPPASAWGPLTPSSGSPGSPETRLSLCLVFLGARGCGLLSASWRSERARPPGYPRTAPKLLDSVEISYVAFWSDDWTRWRCRARAQTPPGPGRRVCSPSAPSRRRVSGVSGTCRIFVWSSTEWPQ